MSDELSMAEGIGRRDRIKLGIASEKDKKIEEEHERIRKEAAERGESPPRWLAWE